VEDTVARRARAACTVHRAAWAAGMKATLRLRGFDTGSMARQRATATAPNERKKNIHNMLFLKNRRINKELKRITEISIIYVYAP
jgi:hypothetical protein